MPAPTRKTASFAKSTALQTFDSLNYYDATLTAASASLSAHTTILAGNPTLTGDTLTAKGAKETLIGGAGNDSLISQSTSTLLLAGSGRDTLVGSASGSSTLVGGSGISLLLSSGAKNSLLGGSGNSTLASTGATNTLVAGTGNATLISSGSNNSLLGNSGTSSLYATGAANTLVAGTGTATLVAGTHSDTLLSTAVKGSTKLVVLSSPGLAVGQTITGSGIPAGTVISSIARQTVTGHGDTLTLSSKLTNSIAGGASLSAYGTHDLLLGGSGNSSLISYAPDSTLVAGSGDATLSAYGTHDLLLGGSGNSSLISYAPGNTLKGGLGNVTLISSGSNNSLLGGYGASSLYASGTSNTLVAGSGAATLLATGASNYLSTGSTSNASQSLDASPSSSSSTLVGSLFPLFTGSNTLVAEGANSSVYGGYGNNLLVALGANDTVSVGISGVSAGSNTLIATGESDLLIGGGGINSLSASGTSDTLIANTLLASTGSSTLVATGAKSSLYGGSGSSSLYASGASSTLVAGPGNATLVAAGTQASLLGGSGANSLYTSADSSTLVAGAGDATLVAAGAGDSLLGGSGTNSFLATGLADTLVAGSGNAILVATGAQDYLVGGSGTSSLIASGLSDTLVAGSGSSTLVALGSNSETLLGAPTSSFATLMGNGHSSLVGQGGKNLYVLTTPGDTISETVNGAALQISGNYSASQSTFLLQTLVPGAYVTASLTGNTLTAQAHTSSLSPRVGDTLTAIGNYNTLRGGAGPDSLIAQGVFDYLLAGGGSDTLIGSSIAGASETLAGNGQASLVGRGANDLFLLSLSGDTISAPFSGLRISASANLNLQNQAPGNYFVASLTGDGTSGTAHTTTLGTLAGASGSLSGDTLFTAANAVILTGGAGNDSLIAAGTNDSLFAGAGRDTLLAKGSGSHTLFGSTSSLVSDTLIGNGHSSLVGRGAKDLFILTTPGDTLHASISGDSIQASYGIQLDTLDATHYYTASLTGDYLSASAHRLSIPTLAGTQTLTGDTLFATGNKVTLLGGAGNDSLVALGNGAYLSGGDGKNTLIAASLLGSSSTLVGDGHSSLVAYQGTNAYFQLGLGNDTIAMNSLAGSTAGIVTITTPDSSFYLTGDSTYGSGAHGSGVTLANNLISTGITGVTFVGGTKSGSLIGNASNANSLVAGSSGSQTLIGGAASDTLVGNGSSSLFGGTGNDLYILNKAGDKIGEIAGSGNDTIQSSLAAFNLANTGTYGQGILNVESFISTSTLSGTGTVYTLTGNGLSNTIVGASLAPNLLQTGTGSDSMVGGALNDTLVGNGFSTLVGAVGKNLYYVPSQRSYQTSGDGIYYFTGGHTDTVIDGGSGGGIIGQNTGNSRFYYDLSQLTQAPGITSLSYNGSSAATLIGNANSLGDTIIGGLGPNSVVGGSAGHSSLVGNGVSDTLNDGGVTALGAQSTMVGGLGNDFYIVSNAGDVITEAFSSSGGIDSVLTTLTAYNLADTFVAGGNGVENLVYTGSGSNVTLRGNQLNNILDARNASASATLIGAGGYDTLLGSSAGSNLFQVLNAANLGSKTSILGGLGTDTLQLLTSGTLGDGAFGSNLSQYVNSVEVLQLASKSMAVLGTAAQFAGITTIVAGTGPDTIDISAYTASATIDAHFDTITSAGQGDSLRGSTSAGTTFLFGSNPNLLGVLAATTLVGQSGQDSLVLNAPVSGLLSVAAGSSGIGLLQLTSKSSLTLGTSAQSLGISTIVAGTGGDTLNASTYTTPVTFDATYFDGASTLGDTLTGSSSQPSTFLFTGVNAGAALTLSSLTGGSGQDSVIVTSATTLGDTAFAAFHSINALVVGGNSAVTLGDNARANGISTLSGLLGNDTFIQLAADTLPTTMIGGSGSALFSIETGSQVAADSITGGFGLDTLQLTSAATLGDASLSRLSSVEVLQLTSSSSVTLGAQAGQGDFSMIIAGTGSDTVDASGYVSSLTIDATADTTNADLLIGSSLGDLFILSNAGPLTIGGASSTITGGTGADTLLFGSGVTLNDALGSNVTGIDVLGLTSSSAVTLGTAASLSGISTIVSGSGGDTIDASSYGASLTFDATSAFEGETLNGPSAYAGSFLFSDPTALASSRIQGGSGGNDSLILTSPMTLNDSDGVNNPFGWTPGIEALCLTDPSAVTLGSYAQYFGYRTVQGGTGDDSISVTAGVTNPLTLLGGAGADYFSIQSIGSNSIVGGSGINTLQLIDAGYNISDADFSRLKNIQLLELTSPVGIDLGAGAAGAGISSVFGGTGDDSFTVEAGDTLPLYLEARGTGNSFALANSTLLARETIAGGSNSDTLSILSDASLADSLFTNASQIGYLGLSGSSSVTLGDNAFATGILTVDGGTGSASVDASTYAGTALTLMSGSSGANLLKAGNGATTFFDNAGGGDTLAGGSGNDVFNVSGGSDSIITGTGSNLVIFSDNQLDGTSLTGSGFTTASLASATAVADSGFKSITGLQSIVLTQSYTSITMGSLASGAGVSSILGGATAGLVLNATGLTSPLTVLAGSGGINSISGGTGGINFTGSSTGSDTFSGGSGNDTISLLDETVTGDFLNGGAGNNLFTIYSAGILANNIMDGGLGGTNSLSFGIHDVTLQDNDFLYATHFQNLLLSGQGNSVTLDTNAVNMGIYSITATGGATTVEGSTFSKSLSVSLGGGSNQINLNANSNQLVIAGGSNQATFGGGNNHISISGSANTLFLAGNNDFLSITGGSNHVTLGGGSDSIYGGSGTEFSVASEQVLKGYYTLSGGGNSTLTLTSDGQTLGGSDFIHVSGINALRFSNGNNAIVAGSQGVTAGISTVYGGSGTDLLNLAANSTDTRLQGFANLDDISVDTLTGGTGSNTFVLGTNLGDAYVSGRGSGQSAQDGYAVITNFDPNSNFLQAKSGGGSTGGLYATSVSSTDFNLFYQPGGTGNSDLIATIHETSAFDLSNPAKLASVLHLV